MSGRATLWEIEDGLRQTLSSLTNIIPDFSSATYIEPQMGTRLWQWGDTKGSRLYKTLAYQDLDLVPVIVSVLRSGGRLSEIELWRGDGVEVLSAPSKVSTKIVDNPGIIDF